MHANFDAAPVFKFLFKIFCISKGFLKKAEKSFANPFFPENSVKKVHRLRKMTCLATKMSSCSYTSKFHSDLLVSLEHLVPSEKKVL